jgi:uncharacterized protein (DUF305 family)
VDEQHQTTTATDDGPPIAEDPDDLPIEAVGGLSWSRVVITVVAFAWLAGTVGWFIGQRDSAPGPASVDAGFYQDMIAHHDQARTLSLMELERGVDPTVRAFAQEIIIFQQYEIGLMDQSLAGWGLGRDDREPEAMGWMGMPVDHDEMPGLATEEQLAELRASSGTDADQIFLELMAEHHRGGAHMAGYAANRADDAGVRRLAARMERNQAVEVNEFAQTAERLGYDIEIEPMEVPDR